MFDKLACQFINDTGIQATYCYSLPTKNVGLAMGNYSWTATRHNFLKKNSVLFNAIPVQLLIF